MPGKALDRHIGEGDRVHVDLTSSLSGMLFPVLELIIITGVCWIGIGFLDQLPAWDGSNPADQFPAGSRDLLLLLWAGLSFWRFGLPLIRQRRFRVILTDRKLLVRPAGLRTGYDSIPLTYVQGVQRRRNTLTVGVGGQPRPYVIDNVPKARKVESILRDLRYH